MKKKKAEKVSKVIAKIPFKDVKFDHSFVMILLGVLVLLLAFMIYSHYGLQLPERQEKPVIEEPELLGEECIEDSECQQPRCPGIKALCENGYCILRKISPTTTKCFDLKVPVCGNGVCEGDEKEGRCVEDC